MGDYSAIGEGIDVILKFSIFSILILLPLAIWKIVDIIIWLVHFLSQHVQIT